MNNLFKSTLLGSGALASLILSASLTSCQDEEFGFTSEEIRAAAYDRNFVAKYGEIDPEQSWDFSKFAVQNFPATRALPGVNDCPFDQTTAAIASHISLDIENEWYYIEPSLLEAFNHNLAEEVDNTKQGSYNFEFTSTGAPFYIVPLFQGISGLETDLHMEVTLDGQVYDKQVWTKGQNLQKQVYGSLDWQTITEPTEAYANYHNKAEYEALYNGSSFGAIASRSKPVRCIVPAGATIKMYVHVTKGRLANNVETSSGNENHDNNLAYTGVKQYSDQGKMIALSESLFEVPEAAKQRFGQHAMIIGCEDASYDTETVTVYRKNGDSFTYTDVPAGNAFDGATVSKWNGDNDMNDLVFMFVSDDLPDVKEKDVTRKRYLIEDLGSVVDWDFNDVVVDVYQRKEDGQVVEQKAMIRQKCGTTNFDILFKVGSEYTESIFNEQTGRVRDSKSDPNWNEPMPEVTTGSEITLVDLSTKKVNNQWPWNPDENNIVVRVYPGKNEIDESKPNHTSGNGYPTGGTINSDSYQNGVATDDSSTTNQQMANPGILVEFPKYGQVPRIIAVDTDFPWTDENQDIDSNLWTFATIHVTADQVDGMDAGVASGGGKHRVNEKVTIKAIANPGFKFKQWSDGNTDAEREITVVDGHDYTAQFEKTTSVEGKNYDVTVLVDGEGTIKGYGAESQTAPYHFSFISINPDGTPNDQGFWLNADANSGYKFLYWSDENGNIEKTNPYYVKSTATLTAHFVEDNGKKPLVFRFDHNDWTNWDKTGHKLSLWVKDGDAELQQLTVNSNGEATYYTNSESVIVVANSMNNNEWDIVYEWSEGEKSYNDNRWNYGGTSYLSRDIRTQYESDIASNYSNFDNEVKKTISVPAGGEIVTVGITSQVLANYALREGTVIGDPQNTNDVPYGEAKINGDARQVFLHKNSSFNLIATANPGYHFVGWYKSDKINGVFQHTLVSADAITRNQTNPSTDGQYFITAVYDHNTYRNLTFNFSNWAKGDAYSVTVNGVEKTLENTSGSVTFQIPEQASVKTTFKYTNKNNNNTEYNGQFVLTGSGNYTDYGYNQINMGGMPSSDMTFTVTPKYQVLAFIQTNGEENEDGGSVSINGGGKQAYLEKGAAATFVATPKTGYSFDGWYSNNSRVSTDLTYKPTHNRELFVTAKFVTGPATPTLTFNIPSADADGVKISVNSSDVTLNNGVGSIQIESGTEIKVKASHSGDYNRKFDFGDGKVITDNGNNTEVSLGNMPNSNKTVDVTVLYQVLATINPKNSGTVSINGGGNQVYVARNTSLTIAATPNAGYRFTGWSNNSWGSDASITTSNPNGTLFFDANFQQMIKVNAVIRNGNGTGSVTITNQDTNESGTNELMVPAGDLNLKYEPVNQNGYRFYTWGNGNYDNPRYITWENQTTDRAVYATFAQTISTPGWGLQNNYEYTEFNNQNLDKLSNLTTNSTLVFFFSERDGSEGVFTNAAISIRQGGTNNTLSGAAVTKVNDKKLVVITLEESAVTSIKTNGFKLIATNMASGKEISMDYFGIGIK